jgi:hypothetical protein
MSQYNELPAQKFFTKPVTFIIGDFSIAQMYVYFKNLEVTYCDLKNNPCFRLSHIVITSKKSKNIILSTIYMEI